MPDLDDVIESTLYDNGEREREQEYGVPYGNHSIFADLERIQSDEYENLFNEVRFNDKIIKRSVIQAIHTYAVQSIIDNNGTYYESMYLLDLKEGNVIDCIEMQEEKVEKGIFYPPRVYKSISRAHEQDIDIIAVHNHPGGYPPSLDDITNIRKHGYAISIAVGHNGQVYQAYNYDGIMYSKEQCEAFHNIINRMALSGTDVDRAYNDMYKLLGVGYDIKGGKTYGKYGD